MQTIEEARQRVADRHTQPYHKAAILRGEWDKGTHVQNEMVRLQAVEVKDDEEE